MSNYYIKVFLILCFFNFNIKCFPYDITIVGRIDFAYSLSRVTMAFIDMLAEDLQVNFISTSRYWNFENASELVKQVCLNKNKTPGQISFFIDILADNKYDLTAMVPNSKIKIAFSMLEGTRIPQKWVRILNKKFNAVIVPDEYYVEVYKKSGVRVPVYVFPCPLYLEDFFKQEVKTRVNSIFTFGCCSNFYSRKNFPTLIKAFAKNFGNNPRFKLKLHGYPGHDLPIIKRLIKNLKLNNVEILTHKFNFQEYIKFMKSLDCYVLLSKGEGFSIAPREALALGIPCIITNNTAHKTICNTGFVCNVKCNKKINAYYPWFGNVGYQFDCSVDQVCRCLKLMYQNYSNYKVKALKARDWVKSYSYKNLRAKFLEIISDIKNTDAG